jgi:hypothetical protein
MSKNTTTVTHPDGTVSKRTSASRIYTHAVEVSITDESEIARLQADIDRWQGAMDEGKYTEAETIKTVQGYIARNKGQIAELVPGNVRYFVLQWSASLKSASAAARKPFWNTDGKSSRVVEVDA